MIASPSLTSHLAAPSLLPATAATDPTRKWITAYAPASAQHLATLPATTALEISDKIARAERAQADWKTSGWGRRRKVMRSLLRWLVEDMEPLARVASRDTGKTRELQSCLRGARERAQNGSNKLTQTAFDVLYSR